MTKGRLLVCGRCGRSEFYMVEEKSKRRFLCLCVSCKETLVISDNHVATFSKEDLSSDLQNQ